MHYMESILRVLIVGLCLGAGLPALFATGLLAYSSGVGGTDIEGVGHAPRPALKYVGILLFVFAVWIILTAIAWITRGTIIHHIGVDLFPFLPRK